VTQWAHFIDSKRKRELLAHLVKTNNWAQVLVFCKTKHGANRLAYQLEKDGINAAAIHGNKSQNARIEALESFKANKVRVLVATDIAARGLDIEALPHVVNFDMPNVPEDYVHRIGRTGRAGLEGEAISIVCHEDRPLLAAVEQLIKRTIEIRPVVGFTGTGAPRPDEPREESRERGRGGRGGRSGSRPPREPRGESSPPREPRGDAAGSRQPRGEPAPQREPRSEPAPTREPRPDSGRSRPPREERRPAPSAAPTMDFSKPYEPSPDAKPVEGAGEPAGRKRSPGAVPVLFRRKTS
jgi:ATP-dependent RNA helicase RhlE